MDRSYLYSRRLLSRARLRRRVALAAAAGVVVAALSMLTWHADPISASLAPAPISLAVPASVSGPSEGEQRSVRRIYPYSVVAGGVSGRDELVRTIRSDRVIAAHYAGFDAGKARPVVVAQPRAVHVSYRKGDRIYWTAHKVLLAPGETLLSDGTHEMRARCANRISDLPQYPVEAHAPTMEVLDQPLELAEGEDYALVADGMPVSLGGEGGTGRRTVVRLPARAGTAADPDRTGRLSSSAADIGAIPATTLSGTSGGIYKVPRPGLALQTETDSSVSSGSPPHADAGTPGASPLPETLPSLPGAVVLPPPSRPDSGPDFPQPGSPALPPMPDRPGLAQVTPLPVPGSPEAAPQPQPPLAQPAPAEVPEPGSLSLFGLALLAMGALRRRRRN